MGLPVVLDIGLRAPPGHRSHAGTGDAGWNRTPLSIQGFHLKVPEAWWSPNPVSRKAGTFCMFFSFWAVLAFFSSQPLLWPFLHAFFGGLGRNSGGFLFFPPFLAPSIFGGPCEAWPARMVAIHLAQVCNHYRNKLAGLV